MTLDKFREMQQTHAPGRRVRFLPTETVRKKIPEGVTDGVITQILPVPVTIEPPDSETPSGTDFGLEVEIVLPNGQTKTVILDISDVELEPRDPS